MRFVCCLFDPRFGLFSSNVAQCGNATAVQYTHNNNCNQSIRSQSTFLQRFHVKFTLYVISDSFGAFVQRDMQQKQQLWLPFVTHWRAADRLVSADLWVNRENWKSGFIQLRESMPITSWMKVEVATQMNFAASLSDVTRLSERWLNFWRLRHPVIHFWWPAVNQSGMV